MDGAWSVSTSSSLPVAGGESFETESIRATDRRLFAKGLRAVARRRGPGAATAGLARAREGPWPSVAARAGAAMARTACCI
jgi:hypothetical protein